MKSGRIQVIVAWCSVNATVLQRGDDLVRFRERDNARPRESSCPHGSQSRRCLEPHQQPDRRISSLLLCRRDGHLGLAARAPAPRGIRGSGIGSWHGGRVTVSEHLADRSLRG